MNIFLQDHMIYSKFTGNYVESNIVFDVFFIDFVFSNADLFRNNQ